MNNTIFMKVKDLIDKTMDLLLFLKIFLSTFVFYSKKKIVFFFFFFNGNTIYTFLFQWDFTYWKFDSYSISYKS